MGGSGLFDKLKRIEIFRGGSIHPLYVTSAGVDLQIVWVSFWMVGWILDGGYGSKQDNRLI